MKKTVFVTKIDEVHIQAIASHPFIERDLSNHFSFFSKSAPFDRRFQTHNRFGQRCWDGRIRLYSRKGNTLYAGLLHRLKEFCDQRGYEFVSGDGISCLFDGGDVESGFTSRLFDRILPPSITPYPHQTAAVDHAIRARRAVILSPTASGKSLIIYGLVRFFDRMNHRTLLIVPTTTLVGQLHDEFTETYGWVRGKEKVACLHGKTPKKDRSAAESSDVVISTWQTAARMPGEWLRGFGAVIGDEAHHFRAPTLAKLMKGLSRAEWRIGTTATINDDEQVHHWVIEGLFGPVRQVADTVELINADLLLSPLDIRARVIEHPPDTCAVLDGVSYHKEIAHVISLQARNQMIADMIRDEIPDGNVLVLFSFVKKHGEPLFQTISNTLPERNHFFIHGGVDMDVRNEVRRVVESQNRAVIVASYGTFSTGINIKRIHHIVFASPSKSRVRVLQSIGRGLRKVDGKNKLTVWDIADDLKVNESSNPNYLMKHFQRRMQIYSHEHFNVTVEHETL